MARIVSISASVSFRMAHFCPSISILFVAVSCASRDQMSLDTCKAWPSESSREGEGRCWVHPGLGHRGRQWTRCSQWSLKDVWGVRCYYLSLVGFCLHGKYPKIGNVSKSWTFKGLYDAPDGKFHAMKPVACLRLLKVLCKIAYRVY